MTEHRGAETTRAVRRHLVLTGGLVAATIVVIGMTDQLPTWTRLAVVGTAVAALLLGRDRLDTTTEPQRSIARPRYRNAMAGSLVVGLPLCWALHRLGVAVALAFTPVAAVIMATWLVAARSVAIGAATSSARHPRSFRRTREPLRAAS